MSIKNIVAKNVNQIGWFMLIRYKECCTVFCRHVIERWKLMTNLRINYYLIICIYMYNCTQGKKFNQSIWVNYHLKRVLFTSSYYEYDVFIMLGSFSIIIFFSLVVHQFHLVNEWYVLYNVTDSQWKLLECINVCRTKTNPWFPLLTKLRYLLLHRNWIIWSHRTQ